MIIAQLFLDVLVGYFNSSFKLAGMFSLIISLNTCFRIYESIRSSNSSHLRSVTSFLHAYLLLSKPAQDLEVSPFYFLYYGNVLIKILQ